MGAEFFPQDGVHFGVAQFGAFIRDIHRRQVGAGDGAAVGADGGVGAEVGLVLRQLAGQPVGQVGALLQFGALGGGDGGHAADDVIAASLRRSMPTQRRWR